MSHAGAPCPRGHAVHSLSTEREYVCGLWTLSARCVWYKVTQLILFDHFELLEYGNGLNLPSSIPETEKRDVTEKHRDKGLWRQRREIYKVDKVKP